MKISWKFYNPVQNHLANLMSGFVKPLSIPGVLHPTPTPCLDPPSPCPAPALPRDVLGQKGEIREPRFDFPAGASGQLWLCCTPGILSQGWMCSGWFIASLKRCLQGESCLLAAPLETCWVKWWLLSPGNGWEGAEPCHREFWYFRDGAAAGTAQQNRVEAVSGDSRLLWKAPKLHFRASRLVGSSLISPQRDSNLCIYLCFCPLAKGRPLFHEHKTKTFP